MTYLLTIGCYLVAFGPAFSIFVRFIAKDPLRVILFVLGAFFWLLSLLVSAIVWFALVPWRQELGISLFISIFLQEASRLVYFIILRKAQKGLNKLASSGLRISGVGDLHNARHMLAVVSGLGMGVIAALFLTMNVFASLSGPGTIGLPAAFKTSSSLYLTPATTFIGLKYALMASCLTLLHSAWTILIWDSAHRFSVGPSPQSLWWLGGFVAVVSHIATSALSLLNGRELQSVTLSLISIVLIVDAATAFKAMGGSMERFAVAAKEAVLDWLTLKELRMRLKLLQCPCARVQPPQVVEVEAEERVPAGAVAL